MSDGCIGYNVSMGKRRKRTSTKRTSSSRTETPTEVVTFKGFFSWCVATKRLRIDQEAEIWTFFEENRLREKEDKDRYLKVLESY